MKCAWKPTMYFLKRRKKKTTVIYNQLYSFLGVGGTKRVNTGLGLTNLMLLFLISVYDCIKCGHMFYPNLKRVQILKTKQPLVLPTLSICKYPQTYMYSEIWVKKQTNRKPREHASFVGTKTILLNRLKNMSFCHPPSLLIYAVSMQWKPLKHALTSLQSRWKSLGTLWNMHA